MKANKALKRLAKVESLISSVTKRLATSAPHLRKALDDLKVAFGHAKEAVSAHLSSDTPKKKAGTAKSGPKGKKGTRTAKKDADKKAAKKAKTKAKAPVAKARKKRTSKIAAKTPVPSAEPVPEVAAQEFSAGAPELSD
jgi:hypothetical protein